MHAVNILGRGLDPHQDDVITHFGTPLGGVAVKHDQAAGRTGRRRQTGGQHIALGFRIERRVEQLVERHRIDPQHRLFLADQPVMGHVHGDLQRRLGGALAVAGLQHPQFAAFHGEFDILHVAIMAFEQIKDSGQFLIGFRHCLFHRQRLGSCFLAGRFREILRGADAGDDILALGVDQPFAIIEALAGRRIAGEGNAGGAGFAHIAEDHRLDIDRGAPFGGDIVEPAVDLGPLRLPAAEHGADRAPQLVVDILRERLAPELYDQILIFADQCFPMLRLHLGIGEKAIVFLDNFQRFFECIMIQLEHHVGIHLDEAAIAVPGETLVAGGIGQTFHGFVVQTEIEHGVHHARHRGAGTGADRDQQRIGRIAKFLAGHRLDMGDALSDFVADAVGILAAFGIIAGTHFGGDGEAGRHRQADIGHFGKIGALAAEQVAGLGLVRRRPVCIHAATETIYILGHSTASSLLTPPF